MGAPGSAISLTQHSKHDYTELEREALDAANAREQALPDLYGRRAESHLGFYDDEMWETADETESSEVSPLKQL